MTGNAARAVRDLIDAANQRGSLMLAMDGMSAAGKSTLASSIACGASFAQRQTSTPSRRSSTAPPMCSSKSLVGQDGRMPAHSAPYWLRPIHRWFFWWEVVVPSIYRVVAVAVGAAATAAMLVAVGLHPLVGAPVALVVWIALAVAQEHDERVELPVDADFHRHLRDLVDPVLIAHGLTFSHAFGPCRARDDRTDAFLYERSDASEGCIDLWLHRNQAHGTMRVDFGGRGLSQSLFRTGDVQLAERVGQALSQLDDVTALRAALAAAPKDFWQ